MAEECVICLEAIETPFTLSCSHVFHKSCLEQWIHYTPVCPVCRDPLLQVSPTRPSDRRSRLRLVSFCKRILIVLSGSFCFAAGVAYQNVFTVFTAILSTLYTYEKGGVLFAIFGLLSSTEWLSICAFCVHILTCFLTESIGQASQFRNEEPLEV